MEYAFPGIVVILKLVFRNVVGRGFELMDFGKSLLLFPVDLSFLGLSFAAISLSRAQDSATTALDVRTALFIFVACILALLVQQTIIKAAEDQLDKSQYVAMGLLGFVAYGLSVAILFGTINVGGLV